MPNSFQNQQVTQLNQMALGKYQSGRIKEAQKLYQKCLKLDADNAEANHVLGVIALGKKDQRLAEKLIRKAVKKAPQYWQAHNSLGVVLKEAKKFQEARQVFENLIRQCPDYADAHFNLGIVLEYLGADSGNSSSDSSDDSSIDNSEAIAAIERALQINPKQIDALMALARIYQQKGQFTEAIDACQRVLRINPKNTEALFHYATCLNSAGNYLQCIELVTTLLGLAPDDVRALRLGAYALQKTGKLSQANHYLTKAARLEPDNLECKLQLADNLQQQRHYTAAESAYKEILRRKPGHLGALSSLIMLSNYTDAPRDHVFDLHKRFEKQVDSTPLCPSGQTPVKASENEGSLNSGQQKIRIAYVSGDFFYHSVAYFFLPLLENHDRSEFEIYCYYNNQREDEYTACIRKASDHFVSSAGFDTAQFCDRILADEIDILVDLSGYSSGHRLEVFARKPAPVQVTWLGYPNTTGLTHMDYRISDDVSDPSPDSDAFHSETLVRLKHGFLCYEAQERAPAPGPSPFVENGYITFGSFNNIVKVTDEVLQCWAKILSAVADSRLILKSAQLEDETVCESILALFEQHGVARERIALIARLADPSDHLGLYNKIDIALDSFPYNGTTTTFEALWMGVPVISLLGDRHAARVGASILSHLQLDELIAENETDYVHIAKRLAQDSSKLQTLKQSLRDRLGHSKLCDGKAFAKAMEEAYSGMLDRTGE